MHGPVCRVWRVHERDFLPKYYVHADFERVLLFTTLKTKESKTLNVRTPLPCWFARARSRRELPYSADWSIGRQRGIYPWVRVTFDNKKLKLYKFSKLRDHIFQRSKGCGPKNFPRDRSSVHSLCSIPDF